MPTGAAIPPQLDYSDPALAGPLSMLGGASSVLNPLSFLTGGIPIPAGGLGLDTSAKSGSTGSQTATTPFVFSSPFVTGDGNEVGESESASRAVSNTVKDVADAIAPIATIVGLAVGVIFLMKAMK